MQNTLAHAGLNALEALILPIFEPQPGEPVPRGIAKYCHAKDGDDAVLLAKIFQSIKAR
jgi:hypothetical protein